MEELLKLYIREIGTLREPPDYLLSWLQMKYDVKNYADGLGR